MSFLYLSRGRSTLLKTSKNLATGSLVHPAYLIDLQALTLLSVTCLGLLNTPSHLSYLPQSLTLPSQDCCWGFLTGPLLFLYPVQASTHVGDKVMCLNSNPMTPSSCLKTVLESFKTYMLQK